jgi:hypothetical protein
MNTYTIQYRPSLPAIIASCTEEFTFENDFFAYRAEIADLLASLLNPVYYVMDMLKLNFDFGEITTSVNIATRIDHPNFRHPNVRQVIFVSDCPAWTLVAKGLNTKIYGNLVIPVFPTLDEALEYIKKT